MTEREAQDAQAAVLSAAAASPLITRLGITIGEADAVHVSASMPVEGNTQPFGFLHGGATAALCESVASIGALLACDPAHAPAGVELSINHLKALRDGSVTAVATPLQQGRTTAVWDVRVHDDAESLVAVARVTLVIISR